MAHSISTSAATIRVLGALGVIGPVVFLALAVITAQRWPGYDGVDDFISELAAAGAPDARLMQGGFLVLGIGVTALAAALDRVSFVVGGGSAVPLMLVVVAVGAFGAGFFQCDAGCPPSADGSWENLAHALFSIAFFVVVTAAIVLTAYRLRGDRDERVYHVYSLVTAVILIPLLVAFPLMDNTTSYVGVVQRVVVVAQLVWLAITSIRVIRAAPSFA
ncbi:MAG: hypothetical protein JJLCMIEE_02150 [Acidimicrobiales bacterium]|nr:MAG: DUF998 domain-containing protein [Actinomycetota bacterium]MBV6509083.1 hypothetical protein [Acidimicrobiales bacterium]RIK03721.1 MAG: hypothetical protein DCC48_15875 [Acidobacteriota bacterium]